MTVSAETARLLVFGIDIEIRQSAVKRSAADAEKPRCQRSVAARTVECVEKARLLIAQRITGNRSDKGRRLDNLGRQIIGLNHRVATVNHGKFNGASELA